MIRELAGEEFLTFIQKQQNDMKLDLQKIMKNTVKTHNFSMSEFWQMPLNLVLDLAGVFTPPKKAPISRKMLIQNERKLNLQFGTV